MSIDVSVSRLAQYRPFERNGLDAQAALTDLVVAAVMESDGHVTSLRECQDHCATLWGLEVELDELRPIFENLVREDRLTHSNGKYTASDTLHGEVDGRTRESAKVEERALDDWAVTLRLLNASLSDDDIALLKAALDVRLGQLIRRHGVEAALLLYPEAPHPKALIDRVEGEGFNFLPRRESRLEEIREQELALFVRQPTEAQRVFLASLLNTVYFMTILTLRAITRISPDPITEIPQVSGGSTGGDRS
ncbi:hypothetical protein Gocc_3092 [Gaiella occulta]|uniref:Uncharacterized protein n=1 Tax=Gaiella occulta TaxID=1002870 RepID=A0A7M2YSW8_9ACTN|nr:hypothetical protein [Gaiella occulta]RDI73185.1 hypothetical protein Gocc_3092 [Gaiella occulta]